MGIIYWILAGLIAGWLTGKIMKEGLGLRVLCGPFTECVLLTTHRIALRSASE